jgi:hypothetical protein
MTDEPILPARTANQYLARFWSAVRAGKIGSPVMRFIINRVPPAGGTAAPSVPICASAAYGCSLTRRKPRGRSGLHSTPCLASTVLTRRLAPSVVRGLARTVPGGPPALHAWFPSVPTAGGGDLTGDLSMPHSGVRSREGFMMNRMTGEPILPARTANQYLARFWSAVSAGKIGSLVMRFIIL